MPDLLLDLEKMSFAEFFYKSNAMLPVHIILYFQIHIHVLKDGAMLH